MLEVHWLSGTGARRVPRAVHLISDGQLLPYMFSFEVLPPEPDCQDGSTRIQTHRVCNCIQLSSLLERPGSNANPTTIDPPLWGRKVHRGQSTQNGALPSSLGPVAEAPFPRLRHIEITPTKCQLTRTASKAKIVAMSDQFDPGRATRDERGHHLASRMRTTAFVTNGGAMVPGCPLTMLLWESAVGVARQNVWQGC